MTRSRRRRECGGCEGDAGFEERSEVDVVEHKNFGLRPRTALSAPLRASYGGCLHINLLGAQFTNYIGDVVVLE
jgi:hypothetical protein